MRFQATYTINNEVKTVICKVSDDAEYSNAISVIRKNICKIIEKTIGFTDEDLDNYFDLDYPDKKLPIVQKFNLLESITKTINISKIN